MVSPPNARLGLAAAGMTLTAMTGWGFCWLRFYRLRLLTVGRVTGWGSTGWRSPPTKLSLGGS